MLLTETKLLQELEKSISPAVYETFEEDFYLDILYNKSLLLYSKYYPQWMRNCKITAKMAVPEIDTFTGKTSNCSLYKIPNFDPKNVVYVDIDNFIHPNNDASDYMSYGFGGIAESLLHKTMTMFNQTRTLYNATFEFPDFIRISPPPDRHTDFTVDIKCRTSLNKIPLGMMFYFIDLFICDVKIDLYGMYPNLRETQNFGGIEIDAKFSEFQQAEDKKREIIEKFEANYMKEPENYAPQFIFQKKLF